MSSFCDPNSHLTELIVTETWLNSSIPDTAIELLFALFTDTIEQKTRARNAEGDYAFT